MPIIAYLVRVKAGMNGAEFEWPEFEWPVLAPSARAAMTHTAKTFAQARPQILGVREAPIEKPADSVLDHFGLEQDWSLVDEDGNAVAMLTVTTDRNDEAE